MFGRVDKDWALEAPIFHQSPQFIGFCVTETSHHLHKLWNYVNYVDADNYQQEDDDHDGGLSDGVRIVTR